MTYWESVFLGILQGLTEFLPVSSSGHLILCAKLFDISSSLFFDVMLHLGTLVAVCVCYRKAIVNLFKEPKKLLYLFLASLPTFAIAFVVKLFVPEQLLTDLVPIGFALTIVMLVLNHFFSRSLYNVTDKPWRAVVCGVAQGIAVLPGLSRSGTTISTLGLSGVKREQCAEFSFLLSIPVILASCVVEGYEAFTQQVTIQFGVVAVGIACSALAGLLALRCVTKLLNSAKLVYFAIYLVIPLTLSLILV